MSIKCVNWALNKVRCRPDEKIILIAMAERADDNGLCWPTQTELSEKTCIPLRTLKRKLKVLQDTGLFTTTTRQVSGNKRRNTYRLHVHDEFDLFVAGASANKNNGAKMAPSDSDGVLSDSAKMAPLIVPPRHHPDEQWCHSSDTINGATQVAHKPSVNHHSSNTAAVITTPVSVFDFPPADKRKRVTMDMNWLPSETVYEQLQLNRPIPREFIDQQLPGFVLYHDQTEDRQQAFDAKFHRHVVHNWESAKSDPQPISPSWKPDLLTIQRLRSAGIPEDYIDERAVEFVMYWLEAGTPGKGWQAKFYDAVLRAWNRAAAHAGAVTAGALAVRNATNEVSLARTIERMTDRSWAGG